MVRTPYRKHAIATTTRVVYGVPFEYIVVSAGTHAEGERLSLVYVVVGYVAMASIYYHNP